MPKIYSPKFGTKSTNSACMADRPEMFGPTGLGGGATRGPTLVAMATAFGLGAESSRLPAC